jgi:dodecin
MGDNVYAVSEIVGSSSQTIEDAIDNALARARKTVRNLDWFEVTEVRGHVSAQGAVDYYQVGIKLGFRREG